MSVKIESLAEAKALYLFLSLERARHQDDIALIDKHLADIVEVWDLYFVAKDENDEGAIFDFTGEIEDRIKEKEWYHIPY